MSRCLAPEEDAKRLALYRQGLSDRQIAKKMQKGVATIRDWRVRRGLPPVVKGMWGGKTRIDAGVSMQSVLPPEQCEIMREFLRFCVTAWRRGASDATKLMRAYREYQAGFVHARMERRSGA